MKWPLDSRPIPRSDIPFYNLPYLHACGAEVDAAMVWGTEVEADDLQAFLGERNAHSPVLLSTAHVLLQATGRALARFPQLNRRVVGRRIYAFRQTNVRMSLYDRRRGDVDVVLLENADKLGLEQIARQLWQAQLEHAWDRAPIRRDQRRLRRLPAVLFDWCLRAYRALDRGFPLPALGRLDHLRSAAVLVNDLSFRGAPPMRSYKPTRFPDDSTPLSVTLGPIEPRPVVHHGRLAVAEVAPLFVRADHRITDSNLLGRFVAALRAMLADPAGMQEAESRDPPVAAWPPRQCACEAQPAEAVPS
jgi:hypothetical protein